MDASHVHGRHGYASGALTFEASGELPALAVRRMLRQHGCADSVASDGGGGGAGEAEQDAQAGMTCAVRRQRWRRLPPLAAAGARERERLAAKFAEGARARTRSQEMSQRPCMLAWVVDAYLPLGA